MRKLNTIPESIFCAVFISFRS